MRSVLSTSLIFLLLVNVCSFSLLKAAYEANKSYFTKNFCVNKAKPSLKCEGKCHLQKTLKKVESAKGIDKGLENLNMSFEFTLQSNPYTFFEAEPSLPFYVFKPFICFFYSFHNKIIKPPIFF